MKYPYIQKVADSYSLPVDALMKVSPDVPPLAPRDKTRTCTADDTSDVAQRSPPQIQKTIADTLFGTTT
ncbi:hypothetical protein Tco_1461435 [Tanacetum coccineum]